MDSYNASFATMHRLNIAHIEQSLAINFSEAEIFTLYDMLLCPGWHTLQVNNVAVGRAILKLFLDSLQLHDGLYWLAVHSVPSGVTALYHEIVFAGCMHNVPLNLHDWYLEHKLMMKLVIIEHTDELQEQPWNLVLMQALQDLATCAYLPVIQLEYPALQVA